MIAPATAQTQEAVGEDAAFEKGIELVFDELRKACTCLLFDLGEKARELLLHHPVQRRVKQAFSDIKIAMDDIATFRNNALPQMAESVLELDRISTEATAQIEKMNRGNLMRPGVTIDV